MTDWLDDEIQRATERGETRKLKLARRESDEEIIAAKGRGFWSHLIASLAASVDRFNNRPGAGESIAISSPPHDDNQININTPGYPNAQMLLRFLDNGTGIAVSMIEHQTPRSSGNRVLEVTIEFVVNADGQIMGRFENTLKDVSATTETLLKKVFRYI